MAIAEVSLFLISSTLLIGSGYLSTKQGPKSYYTNDKSTPGFLADPLSMKL